MEYLNVQGRWTDAHETRLRELATEGYSASQIASIINGETRSTFSRCAVIGKLSRIGLSQDRRMANPHAAAIREEKRPVRRAKQAEGPRPNFRDDKHAHDKSNWIERKQQAKNLAVQFASETTAHLTAEQRARSVGLMQLTDRTCRWPIGRPGASDFCFCGDTPADNKPYCAPHWQLGHARAATQG